MKFTLNLQSLIARIGFLVVVILIAVFLVDAIFKHYVVGTLTDDRQPLNRNKLLSAIGTFPDSARLNARLAEAELLNINADRDLERAAYHAARATSLSPNNYEYRLLAASIEELRGNREVAEAALRKAQELAPANSEVHWRIGNLLVRKGKLADALPEFKLALSTRNEFVGNTLDLLWRASGGKVETLESVISENTKARIALAQFLVNQKQVDAAARVFAGLDRKAKLAAPESAQILDRLMQAGALIEAKELWVGLVSETPVNSNDFMWNGGFESDALKNFAQFDWNISRSDYARFSLDTAVAHGGSRSLKIDFVGKDTTRLEKEIKQVVAVSAGKKYRLECFVKTDKFTAFSAPNELQVVVVDLKTNAEIAKSEAIQAGTIDWKRLTIDFVAPDVPPNGLLIAIRRLPQFSYDEPTKGTVWFDDFSLKEE
ncbi:MAG: hypothetical protein AB1757_20405 [Acidobacteriota bacterium]